MKYTGVIVGVGFAAILFSSGASSKREEQETETEVEVIALDLSENKNEYSFELELPSVENEEESAAEEDTVALSAGVGEVLDKLGEDELEHTETSAEPETAKEQDEMELSAGVGAVFEEAEQEPSDDAVQARDIEVQEEVEPETHWGYTNLGIAHVDNHLNIRQEPNENGKLIGKLSKDAACEILEIDENGWAHIKSGKVEGYCSTEFLYLGDEAIARGQEVASMIAIVNTQTLKVRGEPNTESIVITLIPQEEELEVVEIMDNGWIKFLLDDEEAYVSG
ncbi:MAG: SH3 domain-containing protein, partial [Lachnospiraceae bacterium]|nr:SH3 domain-containing protein [Lachnospiraceae bacterium]